MLLLVMLLFLFRCTLHRENEKCVTTRSLLLYCLTTGRLQKQLSLSLSTRGKVQNDYTSDTKFYMLTFLDLRGENVLYIVKQNNAYSRIFSQAMAIVASIWRLASLQV